MNRDAYLKNADVQDFIEWATPLVTGKWGLHHSWQSKRPLRHFEFRSLYDAYKSYGWKDIGFDDTAEFMDGLRREFNEAIKTGDETGFRQAANGILKWGGINNLRLPNDALCVLAGNAELRLHPERADTEALKGFWPMGSGYSKIYSLLLDDFPIYDSRVACALTSLIRLFCKDTGRHGVPECLKLVVPLHRGPEERNTPGFPLIYYGQGTRYADSNLKAAWLLGALAKVDGSKFDSVPSERRVLALQSSLFMLGYRTLDDDAVKK